MYKIVIPASAISFAFGAALGWAIAADIEEARRQQEREFYAQRLRMTEARLSAALVEGEEIRRRMATEKLQESSADILKRMAANGGLSGAVVAEEPDEEEDDISLIEGETLEETRSNLQRIIDSYSMNEDSSEETHELVELATEFENAPPFVISRETYAYDEEGDSYEKITLTYYPRDRVLLDDDEDPVDDIPRTIGWRNLSQFGGESGDPDVVFVRNRRLETDFEVVKEEDTRLPLHVQYGMEKEEFRVNKAAGLIKLRREDE